MARSKSHAWIIIITFLIVLLCFIIYKNHWDTLHCQVHLDLLIWKLCIFYKTQILLHRGIPISMKTSNFVTSRESLQLWALWFLTVALYPSALSCHTCLWNTKSTVLWGCMVHASHSLSNFLNLSVEKVAWGLCTVLCCFALSLCWKQDIEGS